MTEEELSSAPTPADEHPFVVNLLRLASMTGNCPLAPPIDFSLYGDWLPDPKCEAKYKAWRRMQGDPGRYEKFQAASKWYRKRIKQLAVEKLHSGGKATNAFYLALRHFPPGA